MIYILFKDSYFKGGIITDYRPIYTFMVIDRDRVNLRKGASADYALLGVATRGEELPLLGFVNNNTWAQVFYNKQVAYV